MNLPDYLNTSGPIAVAHRGDSQNHPENTMAAFENAVQLGFDYVETDVHVTRDGKLIAFHDDRLDRVTNHKGRIGDLDWADVKKARVADQEPVPLLEELLSTWPDLKVNLDPKSKASVAPLIAMIKRLGVVSRVCIGSFSGVRIHQVRQAFDGNICTSMGPGEVFDLVLDGFFSKAGPGDNLAKADCAQVPVRYWGVPVVTNRFVNSAHKKGLKVHVWTINSETEMHRLLDMGVDGVMSDDVALLKSVFINRGIWRGPTV